MENEELIRQRMERTRESLTDKLEALEQKVTESVTAVTDTVTDTVANVTEKVSESVDSVRDAMDVGAHMDRHPWLMFGGSVVCGFLLGELLTSRAATGGRSRFTLTPTPTPTPPMPVSSNGSSRQEETPTGAHRGRSFLATFEPELNRLKGLALGATLGTVRELLAKEVPPTMANQLREILDSVTQMAGGQPIPSSDWKE